MSVFTELCDEVYTLTNRPDLIAETKMAVKAATLKAHQSDLYYKDIFETGISFATSDYVQALEYRSVIPKYKQLKYIRKTDSAGTSGNFLEVITPTTALDKYGSVKEDVCYAAGEVIQIKSSTQLQYILFGCYVNPDITESGYNSWIALDNPYAIIFEAAATVYKAIGQDDQSTTFRTLVQEQIMMLKAANIEAEGT